MANTVPDFVRLAPNEVFDREYYIAHTNLRRFNAAAVSAILFGLIYFIVPGLILIIYFAIRQLKISHGYACVTNQRIIYYEFNDHPEENYRLVRSVHRDDITSVSCIIRQSWISRSFYMVIWTTRRGMGVGAKGMLGLLSVLGNSQLLEPGPDAVEFVRDISGTFGLRVQRDAASGSGSLTS